MSTENNSTRDKILVACRKLLEQAPASAVKIADIAKAAGVSRQAVYLHFGGGRADLLIQTTRYVDEQLDMNRRLEPFETAIEGAEKLRAFVAFWSGYLPEISGVAFALIQAGVEDEEARQAWAARMQSLRNGCAAAIGALDAQGRLARGMDRDSATDALWAMLSVEVWHRLTTVAGWSEADYVDRMQRLAERAFVD